MSAILNDSSDASDAEASERRCWAQTLRCRAQDFLVWLIYCLDAGPAFGEPFCCPSATATLIVVYEHSDTAEMRVSAAVSDYDEELLLHIAGKRQMRHELPPGRITGVKRAG